MTRYLRAWAIGGDGRYPWAVKSLRERGIPIKTWDVPGMENQAEHLKDALTGANLVLLPMNPFQEERLEVAGESLTAGILPRILGEEALLVGGRFPEDLEAWLRDQGVRCASLLEQESFLLQNAAVTAEGGVYLALHHMNRVMYGGKGLVIGWGRIGKMLAEKLRSLGMDVTVAVRNPEQKTLLELLGYHTTRTENYPEGLGDYDLIVNTVPRRIMTENQMETVSRNCTIIDLASAPGGFPELQRGRVVDGGGLPGKTAPRTAGEILGEAVFECLAGKGVGLE